MRKPCRRVGYQYPATGLLPVIPWDTKPYRSCRKSTYMECAFGKYCARNKSSHRHTKNTLLKESKKVNCPATITMREVFVSLPEEKQSIRHIFVRIPRRSYHKHHDISLIVPTRNRLDPEISRQIEAFAHKGVTSASNMDVILSTTRTDVSLPEDRSMTPSTRQITNAIQRAKLKLRQGDSDQEDISHLVIASVCPACSLFIPSFGACVHKILNIFFLCRSVIIGLRAGATPSFGNLRLCLMRS